MEVLGRGEKAKDIVALVLGVFEEGNGGEIRQMYLVSQFRFLVVFVHGKAVRSEDNVDGFPFLRETVSKASPARLREEGREQTHLCLCALFYVATFDDPVKLEAAIAVYHGRVGIQVATLPWPRL